jgi:pyrroloquinoline quinone (PQQ) biosynthesis protein C
MNRQIYGHELDAVTAGRSDQATWLEAELDQLHGPERLASHPLMHDWLAGKLTPTDLRVFTGEHYHAVVALELAARRAAAMSEGLLAEQLRLYADDQDELLTLWFEFAADAGWGRSAWYFGEDPLPATMACARVLARDRRELAVHLVTIYAFESAASELAPLQLAALTERYGFDASSTRYFARQAERSAGAALTAKAALTGVLPVPSPGALARHAERVYRSYLGLMDGVHAFGRGPSPFVIRGGAAATGQRPVA